MTRRSMLWPWYWYLIILVLGAAAASLMLALAWALGLGYWAIVVAQISGLVATLLGVWGAYELEDRKARR